MSPVSILPLLALALGLATPSPAGAHAARPDSSDERQYRGAEGQLAVRMPRLEEAEVQLDGALRESIWDSAAVLSDFTQSEPAEGIPATERTEVLLFYTPQALYVGVRAYTTDRAQLRATLADRDNILRDDHVQLLLDTFNDRRRAYALYVNPLGVQQDGMYNESAGRRREERVDFNPDFLFDSRGRVTPEGYEVEVRIPFKSLKFPGGPEQTWGINVIRRLAASGAEESWAPLSRAEPSRLAQSGTLVGIRDLRPGRLLELNPVVTGKRDGYVDEGGSFTRDSFEPDFGGNVKYGLTSNLTLDATYNPDFSQVEADAGQITTNERFAILFPEKRPFFLEGADIFAMPEPLVYTRSIVDPIAGAKLTGKVGNLTVGYLGAVDESPLARPGLAPDAGRAVFNIARLQRDVGQGSLVGAVLTDREAAGQYNRVAGVDGKIRFGGIYAWEFQLANSWTRRWARDAAGADTAWVGDRGIAVSARNEAAHLLQTSLDRSGRNWGFRIQAKDIPEEFRAESGFIRRRGVTDFFLFTRYTWFGEPGALLQSWGPWLMTNRIFGGRGFWRGEGPEEGMARLRFNLNLRGNNRVVLGYSNQFFSLNPARYGDYLLVDDQGRTWTGSELIGPRAEVRGLHGLSLEGSSAYFKSVSLGGEAQWQQTPIFAEGTAGTEWSARGELQMRPTDALRVEADLRYARMYRQRDGSLYSESVLPRLKLEYQLNRSVFVRAVGQYSIEEVDLLRAPDGTPYLHDGQPLRIRGGQRREWELLQTNPLRYDLLFSYEPSPGTVVFLGYGREMQDREAYRFSPLEPTADGLFVKLSYLFRS